MFEIPDPDPYTLSNAPLVQALAQVRYPLIAAFERLDGIAPLQQQLQRAFPYMEQELVAEVSLVVGPAGPAGAGTSEAVTWKFTDDRGNLVVVGAGSATLSTSGEAYTNVGDFADTFRTMLDGLASVGITRCDRVGVRYLSLAPDLPGESRSWRRWFRSEVLGWAGSDVIGQDCVLQAMSQVQLTQPPVGPFVIIPGDTQAVVRHGPVPSGTGVPGIPPVSVVANSYLLDLDVFVLGHQPFDPSLLVEQFQLFHNQIDRFFRWSLTEGGVDHFGLKARD